MFGALARRLFGSANDRQIKTLYSDIVDPVNALEPRFQKMDDAELSGMTAHFRERLDKGETLDQLLPEAFATVREAAKRTLGQRHYDVQLLGGAVLHRGQIAEMRTGEGKTLVSTLPVYLHALTGKGVHVVTVNDYLARRDAGWMGEIYGFLGMTVGVVVPGVDDAERKAAYQADITYGTNNEFGFDYLRDNMKMSLESLVQRPFNFAIVDEVDSILVDEARTPLIISGPAEDSSELYRMVNEFIPDLVEDDFEVDEKQRSASFTDAGTEKLQAWFDERDMLKEPELYDPANISLVHHANQALRAHHLFQRDTHYMIRDDQVVIVDEFTGRMMAGRRFSDGLHQALEAKEKVTIQPENQTLASITFQNYFRMYPTLSGMTGTAATEASEFDEIYGLRVVEIPTHRDMVRIDEDDEVYRTVEEKHKAMVVEIQESYAKGQPVLVGTVSIEKSELISEQLKKADIPHQVLNARYHEQEAQIVAQAGRIGGVTIATNMAGRGTDIQLGGNAEMRVLHELAELEPGEERDRRIGEIEAEVAAEQNRVKEAGGLYVIGTERHESRRVDNQLRGRSGRQGDPGRSKFYLSLQDDLMRIFGSDRMDGMLQKLGLQDGEAIVHKWINKALEKAQQKVEARNFEIRKNLLKFDDVMNDQRKIVYEQRRELMEGREVAESIRDMRHDVVEDMVTECIPPDAYAETWETEKLAAKAKAVLGLDAPVVDWAQEEGIADQEIKERLIDMSDRRMAAKGADLGSEMMRSAEKSILLQLLDHLWKDHLLQMEYLRQGIGLRGYGQKDPLNEYKREAFGMFESLMMRLRESVTSVLSHLEMRMPESQAAAPRQGVAPRGQDDAASGDDGPQFSETPRNAPCPCGSGKKYKNCHGRLA